jgi:hypothetical protein
VSAGSPTSGRTRLAVAAGVATLALALGVLWWASAGGPAGPTSFAASAAPSAQPAAAGVAAAAPAAPIAAAALEPVRAAVEGWNDVPLAPRLAALGPLARPVYEGLAQARTAMGPCFAADARDEAAHPRAPNEEDGWGAAIVTLQLEARAGEVVVVNAPLQAIGTSSPSLVECCENVLRGFRMPAPAAVPGRRYRLQHQLTP